MNGQQSRQRSTLGAFPHASRQSPAAKAWSLIAMLMLALLPVITAQGQTASPDAVPPARASINAVIQTEGAPAEALNGVELCLIFTNAQGEAERPCQAWAGVPLVFDLPANTPVQWVANTDQQPLMQPSSGEFTTPAEGSMELRINLTPAPTPEPSPAELVQTPTEVPVGSPDPADPPSAPAGTPASTVIEAWPTATGNMTVTSTNTGVNPAQVPTGSLTMNLVEPAGESNFPQQAYVCIFAATGNGDCYDISAGTRSGGI